jgi:hypothetical protein
MTNSVCLEGKRMFELLTFFAIQLRGPSPCSPTLKPSRFFTEYSAEKKFLLQIVHITCLLEGLIHEIQFIFFIGCSINPSLTNVHMFPNKKFRPLDDASPVTGQVPLIYDIRTALKTDLPVTSEYLEIDLFVTLEQLKPYIIFLRQNSLRRFICDVRTAEAGYIFVTSEQLETDLPVTSEHRETDLPVTSEQLETDLPVTSEHRETNLPVTSGQLEPDRSWRIFKLKKIRSILVENWPLHANYVIYNKFQLYQIP